MVGIGWIRLVCGICHGALGETSMSHVSVVKDRLKLVFVPL
jgi:hypothetical protein